MQVPHQKRFENRWQDAHTLPAPGPSVNPRSLFFTVFLDPEDSSRETCLSRKISNSGKLCGKTESQRIESELGSPLLNQRFINTDAPPTAIGSDCQNHPSSPIIFPENANSQNSSRTDLARITLIYYDTTSRGVAQLG